MRQELIIFVFSFLFFSAAVWVARTFFCPFVEAQVWAAGFREGVHVADTHPLTVLNISNGTVTTMKREILIFGIGAYEVRYRAK